MKSMKNLAIMVLVLKFQSGLSSSSSSHTFGGIFVRSVKRNAAKGLWMLPSVGGRIDRGSISKSKDSFDFTEKHIPDGIDSRSGRYSRRSQTSARIISAQSNQRSRSKISTTRSGQKKNSIQNSTRSRVKQTALERMHEIKGEKTGKGSSKPIIQGGTDNDCDDEEMWGLTKLLVPKRLRHKGVPVPGNSISQPKMQAKDALHGFL